MSQPTLKQKALRWFYPLLMKLTGKKARVVKNEGRKPPSTPFYNLSTPLLTGGNLKFENLGGKKILLVNTASDCGYTAQYGELQELQERFKNKLLVIGFPSNDFKEQEKGSDSDIAQFCRRNYGITFPLAQKSSVSKNSAQHNVYTWLTDEANNGWNNQAPVWNFSKYLVNEQGVLTHYFDPSVSPLSNEVTNAITDDTYL